MNSNLGCIGLAVVFLLLGACATLDKQECLAGDWQSIGSHDGARGHRPDVFAGLHNQACAKHGVAVNEVEYERGHTLGLADYCQPGTAYRLGLRAETYNYLCPMELQESFLAAYADGLSEALFKARSFEYYADTRASFIRLQRASRQNTQNDGGSQSESVGGSESAHAQRSRSRASERSDNARHRRIQIETMLNGVLRRLLSIQADQPPIEQSGIQTRYPVDQAAL